MFENDTENVIMSLQKVFKKMDLRCYNAVKDYDLTKNEAIILMFLSNNQKHDKASDIIKIRGISKAHVCQSVDSLCKKGFLKTTCDKKDRRIQHLIIQESALDIVRKLNHERNSYFETIFYGLNERQKNDFIEMVKQVIKNSNELKEEK